MKGYALFAMLLLVLAGCAKQPQIGPLGSTHIHADFKVYIEGTELDLAKREYMVKAQHVHIEGMDDDVIHFHATGVTIGEFFRTLGMKFTGECFKMGWKKYCTEEGKTLKFYVNGEPNELLGSYLPSDGDRLLISYGPSDEDVSAQLASVTDKSIKESNSGRTMKLG